MTSFSSRRSLLPTSPWSTLMLACLVCLVTSAPAAAQVLKAGVGRMDITHRKAPVIPMYARALMIQGNGTTAVIVTLDVVAIAEIGKIK